MKVVRWLVRGVLGLLGLLVAAIVAGSVYEKIAEARDAKAWPPPGRMVAVDGRSLHVLCTGPEVGPTVVLIAGSGTPSIADFPVQNRIARFTRVCSYDRPGLGWSPPASRPVSLDDDVADLRALLAKVGAPGPYVLEPESFGGLIALAFTRQYPADVAGLVMVDAAEPALWFGQAGKLIKSQGGMIALLPVLTHIGVMRAITSSQLKDLTPGAFSHEQQSELLAMESRPSPGVVEAVAVYRLAPPDERLGLPAGALGNRPVVVIRHGKPFTGANAIVEEGWPASQDRLARLSSDSRMIVARDNGHEIAQQNPDLVVAAAQDVVARVRRAGR
jgi:pimeloyl-ACP methyl ester carboxylesterase